MELIIVVSILAVIAVFMISGFKNFANFQQYNLAVSDVNFVLNQVRLSARSAESDSNHGVKITNNTITHFVGDVYDVSDPANEVFTYNLVSLNPVLKNGVDEIVFNKLTGLPSATGTIEVSGVGFIDTTIIEITDTGIVQ